MSQDCNYMSQDFVNIHKLSRPGNQPDSRISMAVGALYMQVLGLDFRSRSSKF